MARKTFTSSVEEALLTEFKSKCKEDDIAMNDVLELFMDKYLKGDIVLIKEIRLETK